ncbi:MAG TPA: glycosyltransferase [Arcobacter sp.]|nr:glycosyltransferase [Arcobacter sp.]
MYHQIRLLSEKFEIVLVSLSDKKVKQEHLDKINEFTSKTYVFRLNKAGIFLRLIKGFFSYKPFPVLYFYDSATKHKIHALIRNENPDIIYNQLLRTAEYTKDLKHFKILDYMDCFSEGMKKRLGNSSFPFSAIYKEEYQRMKKYETNIFSFFNKHSIISRQDRDKFKKELREKIYIVPNGVDMQYFSPRINKVEYELGFVGNMGYRPNIIASEYLVKEVLPELKKHNPDITILLEGARPSIKVKNLASDNVEITGWVEDIRDAYSSIMVFIAPIFTGIGQPNKILEAMSMGIPVLTTPEVNKAIGAKNGEEVLVAKNKKEFVDHFLFLLNNPDKMETIGQKGRDFVKKTYSWDFQKQKLFSLFGKN